MGNSAVKPPADTSGTSAAAQPTPQGGCPIRGQKGGSSNADVPAATLQAAAAQAKGDGCPMKDKDGKKKVVYNVYAQPIDPTNQMPANPNQQPAPGQDVPLSTSRVPSHIPKGGTEGETWTYPSPQMFWNALVRKGKAEGANEEDMDVVVAIHNNMNENTWRAVLEWESLHQPSKTEEVGSRLSRFMGRPDDLSPKARIKSLFGHPLPFDRHDWIVERKDGQEVRYVIDYYHEDAAAKLNTVPKLHDADSVKSISIDVRPALDSLESVVDRVVRMPLRVLQEENVHYRPLPFFHTPKVPVVEKEEEAIDVKAIGEKIKASCQPCLLAVKNCKDEDECSRASIDLTYCMAKLVCKPQAAAFGKVWLDGKGRGEGVQVAFGAMRDCMDDFELKAAMAAHKTAQENNTK